MRDENGETTELIQSIVTSWAMGCDKCKHGIIGPAAPKSAELWIGRVAQAKQGAIEFCDCRAGHMMRQYLRRKSKQMKIGKPEDIDYTHDGRVKLSIHLEPGDEYVPATYWGTILDDVVPTPTVHWEGQG